jgi:hypothetical protein
MTIRLFITSVILLVIYGASYVARDRGMPTTMTPLEKNVQDLPQSLGDWKGEAVALDPEMFTAIGAKEVVDRNYRDRQGQTVSVHFAVFDKPFQIQGLWHPPELCYTTHGSHVGDPKPIALDQAGALARLIPAEHQGETLYVLYWYQIDGNAFVTGDAQRKLLLSCRGRPTRPPIIKVMLQTTATSAEAAEKSLTAVARDVFKWTKDFK